MKITIEGWCAERVMDRDGTRTLDLTTLAVTKEDCEQRIRISAALATSDWLCRNPFTRIRRVKVETIDE